MNQLTKITLAWELYEQDMPKIHITKYLGIHRETVHLWITGIQSHSDGLLGFLDLYSSAKKGSRPKRQTNPIFKRWIWDIREREMDCCGQKIQYFLDICMRRRFNSYVELIQSDGGPEFKDKFKKKVHQYTNRYRIASPYKKNEQSFVESFNRTVRKECLGWEQARFTSSLRLLNRS